MIKNLLAAFAVFAAIFFSFPMGSSVFAAPKDILTVYYFHTQYRCSSCTLLEDYTRDTVNKNFPAELKSGKIKFISINIDEPANRHYIEDYQLSFKSVIVSVRDRKGKERKWENLSKVWIYLRNREAFSNYIVTEIQKNLKGISGA